jgi:pimeloyl-ACP methyl ester carboxylesterase
MNLDDSANRATTNSWRKTIVRKAVAAVSTFVLACFLGPISILIAVGETKPGRIFGLLAATTFVFCVIVAFILVRREPPRKSLIVAASLLAIVAVGEIAAIRSLRRRVKDNDAQFGLHSIFLSPINGKSVRYTEYVPEIDQLKLTATFITGVPIVSRARANRIRSVVLELTRSIENDPTARDLGSVAGLAAAELFDRPFDRGHYYAYVPQSEPGETLPAIVFLHGNAGNYKIMPWVWRTFAEKNRYIIICPTFGFGFWNEGGTEAVERARIDACARFAIDVNRIYLGGISDGGKGTTRSAAAHPENYRGLIYISPTMLLNELSAPAFVAAWKDRPIFIAQGDADWNVPKKTVDPAVELLKRQGSRTTYDVYPGEDHFLFFARRDVLLETIHRWIDANERERIAPIDRESAPRGRTDSIGTTVDHRFHKQ